MPKVRSVGSRAALGVLVAGMLASSAAAADPMPKPKLDAPASTSVYDEPGLLGWFRPGPTVGFGAPDGVRVGTFVKWRGVLAAGGAFSYLPTMQIPGLDASVVRVAGEGFLRVHPFRGAFFLGAAGGYAQTKGSMTQTQMAFRQNQSVEVHAYANAAFIAPHLGFQWMLPLNLTMGFDVGVEIPLAASSPTFDASKYGLVIPIEAKGAVADATRRVSGMPVPVVHLLEIGYAL